MSNNNTAAAAGITIGDSVTTRRSGASVFRVVRISPLGGTVHVIDEHGQRSALDIRRHGVQLVPAKGADLIGEQIAIPAWKASGQVIAARPATLGTDDAIEVLVQSKPEDPSPRWYRLEPTEYSIES